MRCRLPSARHLRAGMRSPMRGTPAQSRMKTLATALWGGGLILSPADPALAMTCAISLEVARGNHRRLECSVWERSRQW